jgi:hypothetical protein
MTARTAPRPPKSTATAPAASRRSCSTHHARHERRRNARPLTGHQPGSQGSLTNGYNEADAVQSFAGKNLAGFIQKPYTAAELGRKVKEVLAGA